MQKALNFENFSKIEAINYRLAQAFDILRGESITTENYDVVLLLLSAFKDDIISSDLLRSPSRLKDILLIELNKVNSDLYGPYSDIARHYESAILQLSVSGVCTVIDLFSDLDKDTLIEQFPEIFDNLLYRIIQSKGRSGGDILQPFGITSLIHALAPLTKGAKVYNPFAGLASFGVYLEKGISYLGQEINSRTWALGALRIMAYGKFNEFHYVCEDSILNPPVVTEKFDLIVANPPMGLRMERYRKYLVPEIRTIEQLLLFYSEISLKSNGKLIAILSQNFLYNRVDKRLRQHLIDKDLIDTIISFPGGLLQNTSLPFTIVVINRRKDNLGKVRFISMEKFAEAMVSENKVPNDYSLLSVVTSDSEDTTAVRVVDNSRISELDYNLNVPLYFKNEYEGVKLKKILEPIHRPRVEVGTSGRVVRIRQLKNDKFAFRLNAQTVEENEVKAPDFQLIDESCLLLAVKWYTLNPTYFSYSGTPVLINSPIKAFKVDESLIDIRYLINELHADYVQDQLGAYRIGTTIPQIRREDLFQVVIRLPSLEEQRAKIQGIIEVSDQIRDIQAERNDLLIRANNQLNENFATIKHSLGKPILNIGSALRNIENALAKVSPDWGQVKLSERRDNTLKDTFNAIYGYLDLIHSILKKNESSLDVSKYELNELEFINFIKTFVQGVQVTTKSNVQVVLDIHPDIKKEYKGRVDIKANSDLLEIALNTIVENASIHAFTDLEKSYKLDFRISIKSLPAVIRKPEKTIRKVDKFIKVEVANNGKPFPKNFTLEKLVRKNSFAGETGNTGQGGYDLNEIIKYHNSGKSTLDLITDDYTTEFTTTYSFLIPINV